MDVEKLSDDWTAKPLPEIAFFQEGPGLLKSQFADDGIPFLNIRTLQNGRIDKTKCQFIRKSEFEGKYEHFLLNDGDIVVSSSGTTDKVAVVAKDDLPLMLNTSTIRFRSKDESVLTQEFLRLFLQSEDFKKQVFGAATDAAISNYGPTHLRKMVISFPDSHSQRRIVARVEAFTHRLDQARQARQAAFAEAASVFQRVLENEFSEEATENWRGVPAAQLFGIASGQASPLDPEFKHLPYLGPEHVESGTGRIIGERVSVEELKMKSGKYVFSPGHVVYSKIRPALRKVCLPDYDGLCSADMYPLKPNADEVTREFLLFLLLAPPFSQYALDNSDRNAMPKINREALFGFTFRVPKKPEQKRIAKLLLALRGKLDELQRLQREVEAELASFTPALLAKAFRGEL